jgi:ribosome-binding protein aMBF1 (putative translation factor)
LKKSSDTASVSASAFKPKIHWFDYSSKASEAASKHGKFSSFMERREKNPARAQGLADARASLADALYPDDGATLKTMRLKAGFTQIQFAAALETSQPHVARIESGRQEPNLSTLRKLTRVLGVSLDDLISAIDRQTELNESKVN